MYQNWSLPTFWLADKLTVTDKLKEYTCSKQANLPRKLFLSHSEIWWFETFISIATLLPCTTDLPIYFTCYYTDLINIIKHFKYDKPLRERKKKWKKETNVGQWRVYWTRILDAIEQWFWREHLFKLQYYMTDFTFVLPCGTKFCGSLFLRIGHFLCFAGSDFCD